MTIASKNFARYINYNFVAQAVMSALSGVPSKVSLARYVISNNQHERNKNILESFNAYYYKSYLKAKNWMSKSYGIYFEIPLSTKKFIKVILRDRNNLQIDIDIFIVENGKVIFSDGIHTTKKLLTNNLHLALKRFVKPDPHQVQTIGALPNGLVFKLKGYKFRVGFQYDVSGKLNLDLFSEDAAGIFDLSNKNGRDAAISFLLSNAGVNFQDPKIYERQAKEIIMEISKELAIANKRVKTNKPIKNIDAESPGRAPDNFIPNTPGNKGLKKVVKNQREPIIKNVTPITTTPVRPTKTQRVNKRGFDVVEKRSITYTRKSPSAKLTGIDGGKFYTEKQLREIANDYAYITSSDLDRAIYNLLDSDFTKKLLPKYLKTIAEDAEKHKQKMPNYGSVKKTIIKKTAIKKPATVKQLAARAKFTKMVKEKAKAKKLGVAYNYLAESKKKDNLETFKFGIYLIEGVDKNGFNNTKFVKYENVKRADISSARNYINSKYSYQKTGKYYYTERQ